MASLNIYSSIQGSHGTEVDEQASLRLVQDALKGVEVESTIKLELYPALTKRGARKAGVYVTGYNVHVPNTLSLSIFVANDVAEGWRGMLAFPNEILMATCLRALSPRTYNAYSEAKNWVGGDLTSARDRDLGKNPIKSLKKMGKSFSNLDFAQTIKSVTGFARSTLKNNLARIAYLLWYRQVYEGKRNTPGELYRMLEVGHPIVPEQYEWAVALFVQFGLIEPEYPLYITDECGALAEEYIQGLNDSEYAQWEAKRDVLKKDLGAGRGKAEELRKRLEELEKKLAEQEAALRNYESSPPEPCPLPSTVIPRAMLS